jgi:hypothetical protein
LLRPSITEFNKKWEEDYKIKLELQRVTCGVAFWTLITLIDVMCAKQAPCNQLEREQEE